jgi:hypothetical protein
MEMRPAIWRDIESVVARLSDQHRTEYEKLGYPGQDFWLRLRAFVGRGETSCLWFDDLPQAFISIARDDDGLPVTWLCVTKATFERGADPIRIGRRFMADAVARHGPIVSYLTSEHPQIVRWMKLFGARLVAKDDVLKVFVFS